MDKLAEICNNNTKNMPSDDVYSKVPESELSLNNVTKRLDNMELHKKYILVKGDVEETLPKFLEENPGFRISLLYIDVDLDRPTYNGLKYTL